MAKKKSGGGSGGLMGAASRLASLPGAVWIVGIGSATLYALGKIQSSNDPKDFWYKRGQFFNLKPK